MKEILREKKVIGLILIGIFVLGGGIWFYFYHSNDTILMIEDSNEDIIDSHLQHPLMEEEESPTEEQPQEIMVHITGQVKNPGIVILFTGQRLIDAIDKLGGATKEADLERVNLAQKLQDEQQIYIPKKGETISQGNDTGVVRQLQRDSGGKVNINTAGQEELKTLPGIGEVLAKNIIEYREANGGFKSIEEIKEVNRIGDKIFNEIKDQIGI